MDGWMDDEQTLSYTFSLMLVLSISVGQSYMFSVRKKNLMIGNENDLKYFLHRSAFTQIRQHSVYRTLSIKSNSENVTSKKKS